MKGIGKLLRESASESKPPSDTLDRLVGMALDTFIAGAGVALVALEDVLPDGLDPEFSRSDEFTTKEASAVFTVLLMRAGFATALLRQHLTGSEGNLDAETLDRICEALFHKKPDDMGIAEVVAAHEDVRRSAQRLGFMVPGD